MVNTGVDLSHRVPFFTILKMHMYIAVSRIPNIINNCNYKTDFNIFSYVYIPVTTGYENEMTVQLSFHFTQHLFLHHQRKALLNGCVLIVYVHVGRSLCCGGNLHIKATAFS